MMEETDKQVRKKEGERQVSKKSSEYSRLSKGLTAECGHAVNEDSTPQSDWLIL